MEASRNIRRRWFHMGLGTRFWVATAIALTAALSTERVVSNRVEREDAIETVVPARVDEPMPTADLDAVRAAGRAIAGLQAK